LVSASPTIRRTSTPRLPTRLVEVLPAHVEADLALDGQRAVHVDKGAERFGKRAAHVVAQT
jgi:hypothetical protein